MSQIFNEMKNIRESGGLKLTLNFGSHSTHNVITIPLIQFIIGDCKGNDILCIRKGGHSLSMMETRLILVQVLSVTISPGMILLVKKRNILINSMFYPSIIASLIFLLVDVNVAYMEEHQLKYYMLCC